ncbi:MAG: acyl-CoA dehydrogenase family protein [Candidatus Kapaibacteriales bacterium]
MPFQGLDYLELDSLYSEEELMVRDSVRDFVESEIMPDIERHYQEATQPEGLAEKLGQMGIFGIKTSTKYGGAGAGYCTYGLAMQELERGDSGLRSFASVQNSLVMYPIETYATEAAKEKWLPKLASGEAVGCFGLTEPDHGSNPGGMLTNAKKIDSGYLLNGAKMWITNGTIADIAVVWAKLDGKVTGFLVEKGMKGFSAPEMKNKHSLRASITSELVFEDVEVPEENKLDISGLKGPLSCLSQARFGIAYGALGAAMEMYESSLNYSKSRIQFDKPIAGFQMVQEKLVWMLNEITKGQLLAWRVGRLFEKGEARPEHISMAKRNNVKVALEAARKAREIHGANGILSEYPIMRHANNLESVYTYEGTHDIHTLILGADITGIQAFK